MSIYATSLYEQAMQLSPDDRCALAVQLFESLQPSEDVAQVNIAWQEEIDRRIAEADQQPTPGVSWDEVRSRFGIK